MKSILTPKMTQLNVVRPKIRLALALTALVLSLLPLSAATVYWDINGTNVGATDSGVGDAAGTWSFTGGNFTTNSAGTSSTGNYTADSDVIFSAGSNATGTSAINVTATIGATSLTINAGTVTFGGTGYLVTRGASGITLGASANGSATFNTKLTVSSLATSQTWTNQNTTAGRDLIFNSAISIPGASAFALTLSNTSAGGTTVNGSIGVRENSTSSTLAMTIHNTGSGVTTFAGGNVYTGTTTVRAGTLVVASDAINTSVANQTYSRTNSTFTNGSFFDEDRVVFNEGTTPSGLTSGTVYYVVGKSGSTFQLSTTLGGSAIVLTGTQSNIANGISKAGALGSTNSTVQIGDASTGSNSASLLVSGAHMVQRAISVNNFGTSTTLGGNTDHNSLFSGTITLNKTANLQSVTTGGNTVTFSGVLSGAGGVNKTGTGGVTLTNANTFLGDTLVTSGTLVLSGAGSIATSGAVNVSSGATLDHSGVTGGTYTFVDGQTLSGTGTVVGNSVVAGNLQPGNSPGVLSFTGDLSLASTANSIFEIEPGSPNRGVNYDGVDVSGLLAYDGVLTLSLTTLVAGGTYNLFDFNLGNDSGNFDSVVFSGGIYAGTFVHNSGFWTAVDTNGSGQVFNFELASGNLIISAIPEPSTTLLLTGGLMALVLFRRRRFRN